MKGWGLPIMEVENFGKAGWTAKWGQIVASGQTEQEAIDELMISIQVKIMYDYSKNRLVTSK